MQVITEWEDICLAAAEGQPGILKKMAATLASGALQTLTPEQQDECMVNFHLAIEDWDKNDISGDAGGVLLAAMGLGWDSPVLREHYAQLSKTVFARYGNPAGLAEVMQFRDENVSVAKIYSRWQVLCQTKVGAYCYDAAFGAGKITAIDNLANEVTVNLDRKRVMNLRNFLDNIILVRKPSQLHSLLEDRTMPATNRQEFLAGLQADLLSAAPLPENGLQKILVPYFFSAVDLLDSQPGGESGSGQHAETAAAVPDARRWDVSRSIVELAERLKELNKLEVENPQLGNVKKILVSVAARPEQSEFFATSVALLRKGEAYNAFLETTLSELAEQAAVWKNVEQFVEICDRMPGKLVAFWMQATLLAKGSAYLASATMKMPYRLWNNTEKLLAAAGEDTLLPETVFQDFQNKKVSPDHFYWLWKAPESEERLRHLSNVSLLFKTLHQETKGNYLKSQRLLRKMLIDDEKFQRTIMRHGDNDAIKALVHSIRHQSLLDSSERQSLLVKIVRHFPEAIHEVEERRKVSTQSPAGNFTSPRSMVRSREELRDLVEVQIPENVAAIEFARSLGDLRENSEFKFAKERQAFLARRRAELEERISETMVMDFSRIAVRNIVVPGCSVSIKYESGTVEKFHILGRFDSDPDRNMISYETPLGQALLGLKIGSKFDMPTGDSVTLVAIESLPADLLTWLNSETGQED